MKTAPLTLTLLLLLALPTSGRAEGFAVIVNVSNSVGQLTRPEVAELFLKKRTRWPSGAAVEPVELVDRAVRDRFWRDVQGRSADAVQAYWNQLIFSGREVPPLEKRSDAEVVAFVRANPGAIGLISGPSVATGVKIVTIRE